MCEGIVCACEYVHCLLPAHFSVGRATSECFGVVSQTFTDANEMTDLFVWIFYNNYQQHMVCIFIHFHTHKCPCYEFIFNNIWDIIWNIRNLVILRQRLSFLFWATFIISYIITFTYECPALRSNIYFNCIFNFLSLHFTYEEMCEEMQICWQLIHILLYIKMSVGICCCRKVWTGSIDSLQH